MGHTAPIRKFKSSGVTLIELMIGIAILSILLALALPNYGIWIQNTQIRTAAESVLSGLQMARVEAARRNANVEFTLGAGTAWNVTVAATGDMIQQRTSDGSTTATAVAAGGTKLTFNGLGRVVANADGSGSLNQVDLDSSVLSPSDSRELRITIGTGGIIRMCDPQVVAAGDPRKC